MDNKQIEKAADEYVMLHFIDDSNVVLNDPFPEAQATYKRAFIAGADFALSHQWVSVEDRLPEDATQCLVFLPGSYDDNIVRLAWYDGDKFHDVQTDQRYRPSFWMPIPIPPPKGGSDTFDETDN